MRADATLFYFGTVFLYVERGRATALQPMRFASARLLARDVSQNSSSATRSTASGPKSSTMVKAQFMEAFVAAPYSLEAQVLREACFGKLHFVCCVLQREFLDGRAVLGRPNEALPKRAGEAPH